MIDASIYRCCCILLGVSLFSGCAGPLPVMEHGTAHYASPVDAAKTACVPFTGLGADVDRPIRSLAVEIRTRPEEGSGTTNTVWLDLGFHAWRLDRGTGDFRAGSVFRSLPLSMPAGEFALGDLFEVRLEKKGMFGLTGAPDSGGHWRPETVTLLVDGTAGVPPLEVPATVSLSRAEPSWRHEIHRLGPEMRMLHGLRAENTQESKALDEYASLLTTPFKRFGISGWQNGPIVRDPPLYAGAFGVLTHRPSAGWDGYVSLDLQVEKLDFDGHWYCTPAGANQRRFLRVEHFRWTSEDVDNRFADWTVGDQFLVFGPVKWDTDRGGFYEIHPEHPEDVLRIRR